MSAVAASAPRLAAVARSLALVEGVRLLRHPVVLAGAVLAAAVTVPFARSGMIGMEYFLLLGAPHLVLGLAVMVAVNLAALRARRHSTEELYGSLAAPPQARTLAHAGSVLVAAGAGVVLSASMYLALGAPDGLQVSPDGGRATPSLAELAQGPVVIVTLGMLGLALARWVPFLPAAPTLAVPLLAVEVPLATWNLQTPWAWLAPLVNTARTADGASWPCDADLRWPCAVERFAADLAAWHLLYLAGLAALFLLAALARDRGSPRLALAAVPAAAAVLAGALLQLP